MQIIATSPGGLRNPPWAGAPFPGKPLGGCNRETAWPTGPPLCRL